jgi:hypothetical protein
MEQKETPSFSCLYSQGQRVKCSSGQTGTVQTIYGVPGAIVYAVKSDGDGAMQERFEGELEPLYGSRH